MSLHRFFLENQVIADEQDEAFPLHLDVDDAKHARVLRLRAGEHIAVVDAASDYFECEIVSFEEELIVRVSSHGESPEVGPRIVLLQGLAKGDKFDDVVRHATEVGVDVFVPLKCARSVMKVDAKKAASKSRRWRSIAKSAAMQAGRARVPEVSEPVSVNEACASLSDAAAVLVCWEEADISCSLKTAMSSILDTDAALDCEARIAVVVGPEGGLDPSEVERLLACNPRACLVSLGSTILRTETAGIVAPALVRYELGGLGGGRALR